ASAELVSYAERLLAGAVGSSSARLLVASVVKEEALSVKEVMKVMDEAQQLKEYSRELERKSQELERTSRKLQAANERLREMDQLKDDFIATVTHELRTPITSIRSLTNIVYDDENMPPEKKKEFLEIVIRESERISRLINQVLDLEKMESGHASLNMTEVDMAEVVRTSVAGIRQLCIEREIELAGDIPETISPIRGDRDRLMQVVVNLLSNAIKFCKQPGGLIEVNLYEEGAQMILIVRDNGIGIAPEVQPYIFDKFTQFNDHRSGRPQGSGLGLSISWRIVRIHEGNIRVVSEPGKGAAFIVHLPLRPGAVPPMLAPSYERRNEQQL
ncbi:MAG: sensor histidine kinase, partial [Bacteroidetes bacterium]